MPSSTKGDNSKASDTDSGHERISPLPSCDNPTYESSDAELTENDTPSKHKINSNQTNQKNSRNNKLEGRVNQSFDGNEDDSKEDAGYTSAGDPLEDLRKLAREISPGVTLAKIEKDSMTDYDGLDNSSYPVILDTKSRRLSSSSTDKRTSSVFSDSRPTSFYGGNGDEDETSCNIDKELGLSSSPVPSVKRYFGYTSKQWLSLFVFGFANVFSLILINLQAPFYPQVGLEKGATQTEIGFVFGIFELVVFVLSPILGNYVSRKSCLWLIV